MSELGLFIYKMKLSGITVEQHYMKKVNSCALVITSNHTWKHQQELSNFCNRMSINDNKTEFLTLPHEQLIKLEGLL